MGRTVLLKSCANAESIHVIEARSKNEAAIKIERVLRKIIIRLPTFSQVGSDGLHPLVHWFAVEL
jgi:hypothetical protein